MYGNQIIKQTIAKGNWLSEAFKLQVDMLHQMINRCHHFYFGDYKEFQDQVKDRTGGRKLFMGSLGQNIKLPYDEFLLCFKMGNETKFALAVQKFDHEMTGIVLDFLICEDKKRWIIFPISRLYMFNKTLEETKHIWNGISFDTKVIGDISTSNTATVSTVSEKQAKEYDTNETRHIQKTMSSTLNYFLLLYNQKYIVTETIIRQKPQAKRRKNKTRIFDYKVLCVELPKSGKKYQYNNRDTNSKNIMPFTEVAGTWKTYTENNPMFGNPKLIGDFWVPAHVRGSKQAGFVSKDYCVKH